MIYIQIKRKCVNVNISDYFKNNIFIEFNSEQLDKIKKCNNIKYDIKDKIITNIPTNIIKIVFEKRFNLNIQSYLHSNIYVIYFGSEFNQEVNNLPAKLEQLFFGINFNQKVNNLPLGLKKIFFGYEFNQSVDMLPESLELISFAGCFNQDISNLPFGIKHIRILGYIFNHSIDSLPDSVEIIELNYKYHIKINKLPKNLLSKRFQ